MSTPHWEGGQRQRTGVGFSNAVWVRFPAATNRIYSRQFSRETSLKICILRCSGRAELFQWLPSQKHHPAAVTGLLQRALPASAAFHTAACTVAFGPRMLPPAFWLLRPDPSKDTLPESGYGNRLAFHFHPWSLFSDFGRKSTIYWSLVHSAYSILQGGLSALSVE